MPNVFDQIRRASWGRHLAWLLATSGCASTTRLTSTPNAVVYAEVADHPGGPAIEERRVCRTPCEIDVEDGKSLAETVIPDLKPTEEPRFRVVAKGHVPKIESISRGRPPERVHFDLSEPVSREMTVQRFGLSGSGEIAAENITSVSFAQVIEREGVTPQLIAHVASGEFIDSPDSSPDDRLLLYTMHKTVRSESGRNPTANIQMVNLQEGGVRHVTTGLKLNLEATFTSDGRAIVLASNRGGKDLDLYRLPADGPSSFTLLANGDGNDESPSVGRDALVFEFRPSNTGASQLWRLNRGAFPTQLREGAAPALSPDGSRIAFIGTDHKLWLMTINGDDLTQLTGDNGSTESDPAWSPDGKWIAYVSNLGKDDFGRPNNDLWALNLSTMQATQITTNGSDDRSPTFADGGKALYFTSNRGYRWGLWKLPFGMETNALGTRMPFDAPAQEAVASVPSEAPRCAPMATLQVKTYPAGAVVTFVDAEGSWRVLGRTPLQARVAAGEGRVIVRKVGFYGRERFIDLDPTEHALVKLTLGQRRTIRGNAGSATSAASRPAADVVALGHR